MASEDPAKVCPCCKAVATFEVTKSGTDELHLCVECGYLDTNARG